MERKQRVTHLILISMKKTQPTRIINATIYSFSGLCEAWATQAAFRQEIYLSILAILFVFFVGYTTTEKVLLLSSLFFILVVELINSAIETTIDRISLEHNHLSKRAKDLGSAAVFISLINAAMVWMVISFG